MTATLMMEIHQARGMLVFIPRLMHSIVLLGRKVGPLLDTYIHKTNKNSEKTRAKFGKQNHTDQAVRMFMSHRGPSFAINKSSGQSVCNLINFVLSPRLCHVLLWDTKLILQVTSASKLAKEFNLGAVSYFCCIIIFSK
jgi:hypothetical protein